MTSEDIIESLVDKFDGVNDTIANYLHNRGLSIDSCLLMASCHVVFDQQLLIERCIREHDHDEKLIPLVRSLATEVERLLFKMDPNMDVLSKMEVSWMYDVALITETVNILRHTMNINDKDTHKWLTDLAGDAVRINKSFNDGEDVDKRRLQHDADFEEFFDRVDTDIKRLSFLMHFRNLRSHAYKFNIVLFHNALKAINKTIKRNGIEAYPWTPSDDDIDEKPIFCNPREFMYNPDTVNTEESVAKKAKERGHEYFTLGHVHYIHNHFVSEQFHHIEPHQLYAVLNLKDSDKRLQIRAGEKNRVYHFISEMGELIQSDLRVNWKKSMCSHLGIAYDTFKSKYKEVAESESKRSLEFKEKMETFKESFEELKRAS